MERLFEAEQFLTQRHTKTPQPNCKAQLFRTRQKRRESALNGLNFCGNSFGFIESFCQNVRRWELCTRSENKTLLEGAARKSRQYVPGNFWNLINFPKIFTDRIPSTDKNPNSSVGPHQKDYENRRWSKEPGLDSVLVFKNNSFFRWSAARVQF